MSRLKGKDNNGGNPVRILAICVLAGCAGYTIYNSRINAGLKQVGYGDSILLTQAEPLDIARSENREKVNSLENHNAYLPNVLGIPAGEARPLPSIRIEDPNEDALRTFGGTKYGGQGDKAHLGGFTLYDGFGVSPATWNVMMQYIGVKSVMDVGCGKGLSTLYFLEHGADVLCLEGSHDAVTQTYLPDPATQVVEHDFSRGPYWPAKTYDAVWSVEFLEHVGRNYHFNYVQAFRKAALLFVSHSGWGGWHHVEVHSEEWWLQKFQMYGFHYSEMLTKRIREAALSEADRCELDPLKPANIGPDGKPFNGQHIWLTMMVFVNPAVAALPRHAHLMAEAGCYEKTTDGPEGQIVHRDCLEEKKESVLPEQFAPLSVTPEKYNSWFQKVKARVKPDAR